MTNATIAFDRLVAARAQGGNAHAVQAAQTLVAQHFPGRTFDAETAVNRVFTALDGGNRAGAEEAINEALATLNQPEPTVATDAAVAEDTAGVSANHEARIAALERVARQNGIALAVPAGVGTHEARITALETAARNRGLL